MFKILEYFKQNCKIFGVSLEKLLRKYFFKFQTNINKILVKL